MSENFVDAMSRFATGVTIVSVHDEADDYGDVAMTATSLTALSVTPPTVTLGVEVGTHMHEVLSHCNEWAVTFLAENQRHLAGRFGASGRPSARHLLEGEPYHRGPHTTALIIENGLAALECRTLHRLDFGDHMLLVATVLDTDYITDGRPLVRFRRRYSSF